MNEIVESKKIDYIPSDILFGVKKLVIPSDITPYESAQLSVLLALANAGAMENATQEAANKLLGELKVTRLFQ